MFFIEVLTLEAGVNKTIIELHKKCTLGAVNVASGGVLENVKNALEVRDCIGGFSRMK